MEGWVILMGIIKRYKHGHPVETAHYAIKNHLQDEPAYTWWVQ